MSLTRSFLKGMGLTEEQVGAIIDAHTETVNGLKADRDNYKATAEKLKDIEQKYNDLSQEDWKARFDKEHKDYEDYKKSVNDEKKLADVKAAYRKLLQESKVGEKHLDSIMKVTDFSKMKLDAEGKLEGEDKLIENIKADWSGFVVTEQTRGVNVQTPPTVAKTTMTKADIYKKDEHGRYVLSTAERQKALMENSNAL